MRQDSTNQLGAPLSAFAIGALTGAALALLFAPADGRSTRKYIGESADKGRKRVAGALTEGRKLAKRQRDRLAAAAVEGRQELAEAGEHVAEARDHVVAAARLGTTAVRDVARDVKSRVETTAS